jgi:hypothetical protein
MVLCGLFSANTKAYSYCGWQLFDPQYFNWHYTDSCGPSCEDIYNDCVAYCNDNESSPWQSGGSLSECDALGGGQYYATCYCYAP